MRRGLTSAAAALVIVTGMAGCSGEEEGPDLEAVGQDAEDTATEIIADMTSYNHESLGEEVERWPNYMTAELWASFEHQVDGIRSFVEETSLTVTSELREPAHQVVSSDEVIVYVTVEQSFQAEDVEEEVAQEFQLVRLRLAPEGDGWIVTHFNVSSTSDPDRVLGAGLDPAPSSDDPATEGSDTGE